ncbi:TKL/TKL-ccinprotein kinase [Moniliophthora roreri MCA 2997]|uniref:TKL/TKL-ccinprotein kinase n=1 Tax=Moniliophthora roreri (strain MCA 2997) TaxID=1381753 RepID=V2WAT1_MONRO|nr:TKL/TKL-ccinprotein kinase [Moniliophthora roreri MCA 2997]
MAFNGGSGATVGRDANNMVQGNQNNYNQIPSVSVNIRERNDTILQYRPPDIHPPLTSASRYVRLLLQEKSGYPLWHPYPNSERPQAWVREGIRIGDVGIVYDNAPFDFLFNITCPANDPVNAKGVPVGFQPIPLQDLDFTSTDRSRDVVQPRELIERCTVSADRLNESFRYAYEFSSSASQGAILMLPGGSRHRKLDSRGTFEECARENAAAWFSYATKKRGRLFRNDRNPYLYLVTGCEKSMSWGVASFGNSDSQGRAVVLPFNFLATEHGRYDRYSWGNAIDARSDHRCHPNGTWSKEALWNQCIFVQGFWISLVKRRFRPDKIKIEVTDTVKGYTEPEQTRQRSQMPWSGYSGYQHSMPPIGTSTGYGRQHFDAQEVSSDDEDVEDEGDIVIKDDTATSDELVLFHPCNLINHFMLNLASKINTSQPTAIAISHDDDWCTIFDQFSEIPNQRQFLIELRSRYKFVIKGEAIYTKDISKGSVLTNPPSYMESEVDIVALVDIISERERQAAEWSSSTQAQSFSSLHSSELQHPGHETNVLDPLLSSRTVASPGRVPLSRWGESSLEFEDRKEKGPEIERGPWIERDVQSDNIGKKVPPEQADQWNVTRQHVYLAVHSVFGSALNVTYKATAFPAGTLEFAPVTELSTCARTLLMTWDSLQMVDLNRLQCLRLTERCADILLSICEEVSEVSDQVTEVLRMSILKLIEAFNSVYIFLQKQAHCPFLEQYLKREEILTDIEGCNTKLQEVLGIFSLSIQIRILKKVQASKAPQQQDTKILLDKVIDEYQQHKQLSSMSNLGKIAQLTHSSASGGSKMGVGIVEDVPVNAIGGISLGLTGTSGTGNALQLTDVEMHQRQGQVLSMPSLTLFDSLGSTSTVSSNTTVTTLAPTPAPVPPMLTTVSEVFPTYPSSPGMSPPVQSTSQLPPLLSSPTFYINPNPDNKSILRRSINSLLTEQNVSDAVLDAQDLQNLMREALARGSDVEMLSVLGVDREEMPEVIKAMQHVLEGLIECEQDEEEGLEDFWAGNEVRRSKTVLPSTGSSSYSATASSGFGSGQARSVGRENTLDREFIENGIDALKKLSRTYSTVEGDSLPSWTITRYEVDCEKIGIGTFSDVYQGKWRNLTVAIKVLPEMTPRNLFIHKMEVWKGLKHANVLELLGASSASGEPPWFFVSPYMKNRSLSNYLHHIINCKEGPPAGLSLSAYRYSFTSATMTGYEHIQTASNLRSNLTGTTIPRSSSDQQRSGSFSDAALGEVEREWDLLRFMHEIAKGMDYLHGNRVLHGDLKAANVLVDDWIHCVISDFGQSEMKSEAYRISGTPVYYGTLRWQAPKLMDGQSHSQLTVEMDVYAFAITCIEVLSMGCMPWPLMDDYVVRCFVLIDGTCPTIPQTQFSTPAIQDIIQNCWKTNPFERLPFSIVARDLKALCKGIGADDIMSPTLVQNPIELEHGTSRPSPDIRPTRPSSSSTLSSSMPLVPLPDTSPKLISDTLIQTAKEQQREISTGSLPAFPTICSHQDRHRRAFYPSLHSVDLPLCSVDPVVHEISSGSQLEEDGTTSSVDSSAENEYDSSSLARNEREYRRLLVHEFHLSLTLPLWSPSHIAIGAVGYLSKPEGVFVTLFNAFQPEKSSEAEIKNMPVVNWWF